MRGEPGLNVRFRLRSRHSSTLRDNEPLIKRNPTEAGFDWTTMLPVFTKANPGSMLI
jgi:hypothetical protein